MNTSLFDRYMSGDVVRVWNDIRDFGSSIQSAAVRTDAWRVAAETMRRAQSNVNQIVHGLHELRYEFAVSSPLQPPNTASAALIEELDAELNGDVPLSLKAWYTYVGPVDLRGMLPLLCQVAAEHEYGTERIRLSDPLVIAPIEQVLESFSQWKSGLWGNQPFRLKLSPDDLHKANISGGTYDMAIDKPCGDALFADWHSFYFVDYVRCVFEWGGFPGWERYPDYPSSEIAYLRKGLLPL